MRKIEKLLNFNPFPHVDAFWCICSRRLLKTLCQKRKLLCNRNRVSIGINITSTALLWKLAFIVTLVEWLTLSLKLSNVYRG